MKDDTLLKQDELNEILQKITLKIKSEGYDSFDAFFDDFTRFKVTAANPLTVESVVEAVRKYTTIDVDSDGSYRVIKTDNIENLARDITKLATPQDNWISVDERLPERRLQVYISVTNNNACVGYIHSRGHWIIQGTDMSYKENELHKVTHWQPLPLSPSKPGNNG